MDSITIKDQSFLDRNEDLIDNIALVIGIVLSFAVITVSVLMAKGII